nr:copia protein [Tanacetum cinerariifolium]
MTVTTDEKGFISAIYEEKTHVDLHTCLFACFLSQKEPERITNALKDSAWVEGCTQKEGIDYDEVFAPVARIGAIRLFLAYASFMGFLVYQMDVKSAFMYGRIEEEVYVCQPPGFEDPDYPDKELCTEFEVLMHNNFQMSSMGELTFFLGLQVKKKSDGIFISQDKYVDEILRKFKYEDVKPASTPMDKEKALLKDLDGDDVDVHL